MWKTVRSFGRWCRLWIRFHRTFFGLRLRRRYPEDLAFALASGGLMAPEEAETLHQLARDTADGCIVEIGSYHGLSTVALAKGARRGHRVKVYAVDPYVRFTGPLGTTFEPRNRRRLLQNLLLAGVADDVWCIHLQSEQAARGWREPVGLLWIDGDHSYEGVRKDFDGWSPHLLPGGLLAFHDSTDERLGPRRLIAELLSGDRFALVKSVETLTVLRKEGSL